MPRPKLALHWQILLGMVAGIVFGLVASSMGWSEFTVKWIKPWGTIFINMLKLIAVPLIITSLIKGVSDLQDISKFSRMGGRTILMYLFTTVIAISIGLAMGNLVAPGKQITAETRAALLKSNQSDEAASQKVQQRIETANQTRQQAPLQPLMDIVPDNLFSAASDNRNMLQVIFFVIFFGIGLILVPNESSAPVKAVVDGLNDVVLKLVDLIMLAAPFGVFALLASLIVDAPSKDLLVALSVYSLCVVGGLGADDVVVYPTLVVIFARRSYREFFRGISPAQLLAFQPAPVRQRCL